MEVTRLRVGVIGAGGIASGVHFPALREIERCELVWVCDLNADRARAAADRWGVPLHGTSYAELISELRPDAVFVLVQPDQCFRVAMDAMRAGCHVFIEKPMGITGFQAESMARASLECGVQCQLGFNRRFIPLVREVLKEMRALGPVHQVDGWFYKHGDASFYDGCASAFLCDTIHTIDLVRHAVGAEATDVAQLAARHGDSPVDNAWNALIGFENGAVGTVHANYLTGGRVHGLAIHGAGASAYLNLGFGGAGCSARILYHVQGTFSLSAHGAGAQRIKELDGMQIAGSQDYHRYYGYFDEDAAFVRALLAGEPVPCGAQDALESMRLAERLLQSQVHIGKVGIS